MSNEEFKMAQLRLGRIYPVKKGDTVLEPDDHLLIWMCEITPYIDN
jgi:hypothetical protein